MQPNNNKAENEALNTYNLLDQIGRVEGDPWLFERIQTRLKSQGGAPSYPIRVIPAWEWALVALAFVASTLFFSVNLKQNDPAQSLSEALAKELDIQENAIYQIDI